MVLCFKSDFDFLLSITKDPVRERKKDFFWYHSFFNNCGPWKELQNCLKLFEKWFYGAFESIDFGSIFLLQCKKMMGNWGSSFAFASNHKVKYLENVLGTWNFFMPSPELHFLEEGLRTHKAVFLINNSSSCMFLFLMKTYRINLFST